MYVHMSFPTFILRARTVIPFPGSTGSDNPAAHAGERRPTTARKNLLPTGGGENPREPPYANGEKHQRETRSTKPIETIAVGTRERSLWSRSDPPNNSHETPLPFPPAPSPCPSSLSLAIPSPRPLFLASSSSSRASSRSPTAFPPFYRRPLRLARAPHSFSFAPPFAEHERAIARVGVRAVVPRCFSPTTRLPLSPRWGHRVARYRSAISRIPASPRDAPISAMAATAATSLAKKGALHRLYHQRWTLHPYGVGLESVISKRDGLLPTKFPSVPPDTEQCHGYSDDTPGQGSKHKI